MGGRGSCRTATPWEGEAPAEPQHHGRARLLPSRNTGAGCNLLRGSAGASPSQNGPMLNKSFALDQQPGCSKAAGLLQTPGCFRRRAASDARIPSQDTAPFFVAALLLRDERGVVTRCALERHDVAAKFP